MVKICYACRAAIEFPRYTKAPKEGLPLVSNLGVGVTLVMLKDAEKGKKRSSE